MGSKKYNKLENITGEGNGTPLQYSCLENPRDRGAWWAAIYGVTQSRTRLKRLSSSREYNKKEADSQIERWGLVTSEEKEGEKGNIAVGDKLLDIKYSISMYYTTQGI